MSRRQTVAKGVTASPGPPRLRDERPDAAPRPSRVSSTAVDYADPVDLEARSVHLIEHLQQFFRERENALASLRNDPHMSGGRLASREDDTRIYGRHGPQSSQFFGANPERPGTK